jgi:hypothetical protein
MKLRVSLRKNTGECDLIIHRHSLIRSRSAEISTDVQESHSLRGRMTKKIHRSRGPICSLDISRENKAARARKNVSDFLVKHESLSL